MRGNRGNLVSSTVTACAAVLTLPFLATPSGAAVATTTPPDGPAPEAAPGATAPAVPGSTRSLPLVPLGHKSRAAGVRRGEMGVSARDVRPFSLVGVVWDDATAELRGHVEIRTRALDTHAWSGWQDLQEHDDDRPDLDSAEARGGSLRGSTAPLWVGASDAVQVRVRQDPVAGRTSESSALPSGLKLELVDPGTDPAKGAARTAGRRGAPPVPTDEENAASAANAPLAPLGALEIPALDKPASEGDVAATHVDGAGREGRPSDSRGDSDSTVPGLPTTDGPSDDPSDGPTDSPTDIPSGGPTDSPTDNPSGSPSDSPSDGIDPGDSYPSDDSEASDSGGLDLGRYVGPRPRIVTRAGWGADESIRERNFPYTKTVKAAFVHHTASGNGYSCAQSASVIRGIYRYHVVSSGWRDIGYNFLIDKCGTVYEGRAGGVAKPVRGAHTLGFNTNSMGIAVLGSFGKSNPSSAAVDAVAALTSWKLGLYGVNPLGTASLVSGGGNLFKKGTTVRLKVISGHRDGYATECPGERLYSRLGGARSAAARLQGR